MSINDEMSIGESAAKVKGSDSDTIDTQTFDIVAWVNGVQPVRRGTTVYARGDLLADLDILREQIGEEREAGRVQQVAALSAQADEIAETIRASAVDIVVEARSGEWLEQFWKTCKDAEMSQEDTYLAQVAAQIVAPEGFTGALLREFSEKSPHQAALIFGLVHEANNAKVDITVPS